MRVGSEQRRLLWKFSDAEPIIRYGVLLHCEHGGWCYFSALCTANLRSHCSQAQLSQIEAGSDTSQVRGARTGLSKGPGRRIGLVPVVIYMPWTYLM